MKNFRLKSGLLTTLLFLVGLGLGVLLSMPWELVWTKALVSLDRKLPTVSLSWLSVEDGGMTHVRVHGLRLTTPKATLHLSEAQLEVGLDPMVRIRLLSGEGALEVVAGRKGAVVLQGTADLGALLNREDLSGLVRLDGDAVFDDFLRPPTGGRFTTSAKAVEAMGMQVQGPSLVATLSGNDLQVESFKVGAPFPLQGSGVIRLNWANVMTSSFDMKGTILWGGKNRTFHKTGQLRNLGRLASGG
jgi:hypothetical protein